MSPQRTAHRPAAPTADVVEWRRHQLAAAGFAHDLAADLAEGNNIDLHAVLDLVDHGCPPKLAARIFAPLDKSTTGRCSQ